MSPGEGRVENPWIPAGKLPVKDLRNVSQSSDGDSPAIPAVTPTQQIRGAWYASDRQRVDSLPAHRRVPSWTEAVHPHLGGRPVDPNHASWWWLGVHGGSGVSTLLRFVPGGADAQRRWPEPGFGGPPAVVLVCRAHLSGLARARDAATQWAAADVPAGLLLAGAVVSADSPGRPARAQVEAQRLLEGVVPRLWTVPWVEELRWIAEDDVLPVPPGFLPLRHGLESLRSTPAR